MKHSLSPVIAIVLLLIGAATRAESQQTASVIGVARVLRGSFPEPVIVNLQLHGATIESTYLDGEGRFSFNALPPNVYHVTINDDRYTPVDIAVNVRPDISPVNMLQITLMARQAKSEQESQSDTSGYVVSPADFARNYNKKAVKEFQLGMKTDAEGKSDEAIEHYRKAIKEAPDFYPAHNNLGSAYLRKGQFTDAEKEFRTAMQLNPNDPETYFNFANLLLLTKRVPDCLQTVQQGLSKQPNSAFGHFVYGSALERMSRFPDAEVALRRALELDPSMTKAHLELVNLYLQQQKKPEAIAELQAFLKTSPNDPLSPRVRELLNKLQASSK